MIAEHKSMTLQRWLGEHTRAAGMQVGGAGPTSACCSSPTVHSASPPCTTFHIPYQDIHYTFAGYAPLSVRLVQQALSGTPGGLRAGGSVAAGVAALFEWAEIGAECSCCSAARAANSTPPSRPTLHTHAAQGWAGIESLLQQLPGHTFEVLQTTDEQGMPVERRQGASKAAAEAAAAAASGRRRRVLVMFIGGVTCAEVRGVSMVS